MRFLHWLADEAKAVAAVTLYFAACFVVIMLLKQLWLAEYGIELRGIPTALLAAVITAKVVIVLDHSALTARLRAWPGLVEVIAKSAVYTLAVLVVMLLEKAFDARTEQGGFPAALASIFHHPDMPKVWATAIAVGLSFLGYTAFAVVRRAVGAERLRAMFLSSSAAATRAVKEG